MNRFLRSKNAVNYFWNILFLTLVVILFVYCAWNEFSRLSSSKTIDFYHFYKGAGAILNQTDLYTSGRGGYIYPPFFAFLLTPLAHLSYEFATMVWLIINITLIIVSLYLGFRVIASAFCLQFNLAQAFGACALAVLMSCDQVRWELLLGQSDTLILAGFALALYWLDRKPLIAGLVLGAIANIKYYPIFFLPYFLLRGRWRVAIGLVMGIIAAACLPALMIGWDLNLIYLETAVRGVLHISGTGVSHVANVPDITWARNITITSGLTRIFLDHGLPKSALVITILVIAAMVFCLFWRLFQQNGIPFLWRRFNSSLDPHRERIITILEWNALLIGILVFSPQNTTRHFFLTLNVNLFAIMMLMFPKDGMKRYSLMLGILIAQLGFAFHFPWNGTAIWHYIGAPSWCLLVFIFLTTYSTLYSAGMAEENLRT